MHLQAAGDGAAWQRPPFLGGGGNGRTDLLMVGSVPGEPHQWSLTDTLQFHFCLV